MGGLNLIRNNYWLILFAILTVLTLSLPGRRWRGTITTGIIGGWFSLTVNLIGSLWLGLWSYNPTLMAIYGIPVFVVLSAIPAAMLFEYWFRGISTTAGQIAFIVVSSFGVSLSDWVALRLGALEYVRWGMLSSFGLTGLLVTGLAYYLDATRLTHNYD
jgi:hypothetical protein